MDNMNNNAMNKVMYNLINYYEKLFTAYISIMDLNEK